MRGPVAFVFVKFPKLTEMFILREILALQGYGMETVVISLLRPAPGGVVHPEAEKLQAQALYPPPFLSPLAWRAHYHFFKRAPRTYLSTFFGLIMRGARSPLLMLKTVAVFIESVHFAKMVEEKGVQHLHAVFAAHNATSAMIVSKLTGVSYSISIDAYDLYIETAFHEDKFRDAAFLRTTSFYHRKYLIETFGGKAEDKTHLVYRGVDVGTYKPGAGDRRGGERPFIMLCVGSLEERKGHTYLLEAVEVLRSRGRKVVCHIVGDGPLKKELQSQISVRGLQDHVVLEGEHTHSGVREWLKKADCFVLPSVVTRSKRMEGIPNVLMEAMAFEVPVISTRIAGIPELVEDGRSGMLVSPADPSGIARSVEYLQDNPREAATFGREGRRRVVQDFNTDINTKKLHELFQGVPVRRPGGTA